jgi:LCP family protein required for cell wall assembly
VLYYKPGLLWASGEHEHLQMSNDKPRKPDKQAGGRAYTGKTIVLPKNGEKRSNTPRPDLPKPPRVYRNPPPSQRGAYSDAEQGDYAERSPRIYASGKAARKRSTTKKRRMTRRTVWQRVRRGLLLFLLVAAVLLGIGTWALHRQVSAVADAVVVSEVRSNPPINTALLGGVNILLVGVDERPDHPEEGVRSDTLILARINAPAGWISLLSIPRDTQVELPDVGQTKINVAYGQGYAHAEDLYGADVSPAQGGMALAAQSVEQFLGLGEWGQRVHYTAQINFDGFVGIIDALGGITIDVPYHIVDNAYPTPDYGYMRIEFQPGPQEMDGQTALIYARTRHADSDFGRAERQQQVLRAIVAELQARGWAGRVAAVPEVLGGLTGEDGGTPPVLTTMPFDRPDMLLGLTLLAGRLDAENIGRTQISPENVQVTEIGSNLVWEREGVRRVVNDWLDGPDAPDEEPAGEPAAQP